MPYITSVEQIGYDRGQAVGYDLGVKEADERLLAAQRALERSQEQSLAAQRSLLVRQLNRKLGPISADSIDQINTLPIAQLESLGEALLDFGSIADLTAWLDNQE